MNNKEVFQLNEKRSFWVDRTLGGMTLEEKVGVRVFRVEESPCFSCAAGS